MTEPISPDEVVAAKEEYLPPVVMKAWNETIAKHWDGSRAKFKQDEIVEVIMGKMLITRGDVFDRKYLTVTDIYKSKGWKVEYDKPAYCETYDATYEFSK